jgi:hypothetical protein
MKIRYVGDLSRSDASCLHSFGIGADSILEFGSGASTQIFAQCNPRYLVSVETNTYWVEATKQNLDALNLSKYVQFADFDNFPSFPYKVIFVDGIWEKRAEFAMKAWPMLAEDGVMIFHDTRRSFDVENVCLILKNHWSEITNISVNYTPVTEKKPSNCTVIRKGPKLAYENWNEVEGKEPWMWGQGKPSQVSLWPTV